MSQRKFTRAVFGRIGDQSQNSGRFIFTSFGSRQNTANFGPCRIFLHGAVILLRFDFVSQKDSTRIHGRVVSPFCCFSTPAHAIAHSCCKSALAPSASQASVPPWRVAHPCIYSFCPTP